MSVSNSLAAKRRRLHRLERQNVSALRKVALAYEDETGYDSIDTIESVYECTEAGAYLCPYPHCKVARHDPLQMWFHVHGGHGDHLPIDEFVQGVN
jgi:hypothetical protein